MRSHITATRYSSDPSPPRLLSPVRLASGTGVCDAATLTEEAIIGERHGLRPVMDLLLRVAPSDVPVLVVGETGSGKEVIAQAIHDRSQRARGPLVKVNCGAIPPELVDSELFGHERGSFTGAVAARKGWFERADGGTLFLDEVADLPLAAQVRLLRVLQDGTFERVGAQRTQTVGVRVVAATHRDLGAMVAAGQFRRDLWYRLSVFPIRLPALRERGDDLALLAAHFAARMGERAGGAPLAPTDQDLALLRAHTWPGNVRELAAVIERAVLLGGGRALDVAGALELTRRAVAVCPPAVALATVPSEPLAPAQAPAAAPDATGRLPVGGDAPLAAASAAVRTLEEVMKEHIARALLASAGRIEGAGGAAALLGVNPHTLRARMRKLGIDWAQFRGRGPNGGR